MSNKFSGGTVIVWTAFSVISGTQTCWISTKINLRSYTKLLDEVFILFLNKETGEDTIFQQDNASIHSFEQK
jgi:uncharacterized membrane protein YkvI